MALFCFCVTLLQERNEKLLHCIPSSSFDMYYSYTLHQVISGICLHALTCTIRKTLSLHLPTAFKSL